MTPENVQTAILQTLKDIQAVSGRAWHDLPLTAVPIRDVEGFDSLLSVEATMLVEEKLGCGELKGDSIFISDDGQRALSISEIAEKVIKMASKKGGNND